MKELVIIGAGPAGISAGIYGLRAGLDLVVLEKFAPGGQVLNTSEVENYPGFAEPVMGYELIDRMEQQLRRFNADIQSVEIKSVIKNSSGIFETALSDGEIIQSKAVIAATGSSYKKLNVPGEKEFTGKGVSYCATCDGAFFKDKTVAVIGGGNTALEDALFLTRFASKVYLIHRRDEFRGERILQQRVTANEKIEIMLNTTVESINGSGKVESISLICCKDNDTKNILKLDGVFIFVGYDANTGEFPDELKNEYGQIKVNLNMETSIPGFFAAGDIRSESKRQIVMACSDGATAAMSAYEFITNKKL
ncbi:MAG: thioredoxin-disulfide reductase [Spirochaetes bacterium]|nr:thioredoxin-disulfide reductase [Spirochaetota bacterium]